MATARRSLVSFVGILVTALVIGAQRTLIGAESAPASQSDSIQLPPRLRPGVEAMLRQSATFRAQYRRLADTPSLVVVVQVDPTLSLGRFRARSTIRRYDSGFRLAIVSVEPGHHQWIGWLAHEFEDVVEHLDGLNLREMATRGIGGAWYSGADAVETTRAIRAGRAVLAEARRRIRQSDKLVE